MQHLWLIEKVWFRGKIDLKKELSRWKRRYTTLSKFRAPGSWAPGSVNVDDFNFSPPYVVTGNKHVDFHTRVVRLKEDFWIFCKVWLGHLHISFCLSNTSLNDWISTSLNVRSINIGPLQFAAATVLWKLVIVIKSLKYSLSLKERW